jgi:hypothetical protein
MNDREKEVEEEIKRKSWEGVVKNITFMGEEQINLPTLRFPGSDRLSF